MRTEIASLCDLAILLSHAGCKILAPLLWCTADRGILFMSETQRSKRTWSGHFISGATSNHRLCPILSHFYGPSEVFALFCPAEWYSTLMGLVAFHLTPLVKAGFDQHCHSIPDLRDTNNYGRVLKMAHFNLSHSYLDFI